MNRIAIKRIVEIAERRQVPLMVMHRMDSGFRTINAKTTRRICEDHGTTIHELIEDEYGGESQDWYEIERLRAWLGY